MAAKAFVPVEALPRHLPLSGPWAPPTTTVDAPPTVGIGQAVVGAGHARESVRSGGSASTASTAFGAMGSSYNGGGCAADRGNRPGCCRSGPCPRKRRCRSKRFLAFTAFGAMGPSYNGGGCATDRGNRPGCCRSGPCPRKRRCRSKRFLAFTAFGAMGPSYGNRLCYAACSSVGALSSSVSRRMSRLNFLSSNGRARCIVQRLSQITRS